MKIQSCVIVILLAGCFTNKELSRTKPPIKEELVFLSTSEIVNNHQSTCEAEVSMAEYFELVNADSIYYSTEKPNGKASSVFVQADDFTAPLKVGIHTTFFKDGNIRSVGEYKIRSYTQCCTGGFCCEYYHYKYELWNYYYNSGNTKATIKYDTKTYKIRTSCDAATMVFHAIKSVKLWDPTGKKIKLLTAKESDEYLREVVDEEFSLTEYRPINDSLSIDLAFKYGVEH